MKRFFFIAAVLVIAGVGCKSIFVPTETVIAERETNRVANVTAGAHGRQVTNYATVISTNYVTNTVYDLSPGLTNLLSRGKQVASDLPAPWNWIGTSALAVTTGVLGGIARKKSRQAALVTPLIAGIETASNNADVKRSIRNHATLAGVQDRLHNEVKRLTGSPAQ